MDLPHRLSERCQCALLKDPRRERLGQAPTDCVQERVDEITDRTRVKRGTFHKLGGVVHRNEAAGDPRGTFGRVDLGMDE